MPRTVVVAIGGNSLITDARHQTVPDQYHAVEQTCDHLTAVLRDKDIRLVITHGNGPQVGFILQRSEIASSTLHQVPLDSCVADTQGALGYQLQRALHNAFRKAGIRRQAVAVVTQVLVDANDPAFRRPSKPIGSFLTQEKAEEHRQKDGWEVVEDAGRGWRRVVSSPKPVDILEVEAVRTLLDAGFVVIAAGGGGIAVVDEGGGQLGGAAAVVDKDLASSLLARRLAADLLVVSTAVERVCLDYGKPTQRALETMTVAEARRYATEGHFQPGSMLPKVEALVSFLEGGGKEGLITDPAHLAAALEGRAGTRVVP
ncbi:MAG TPA: carbamate kinase [Anaeromyxobacter sp.]|nr:carbamate kinase [Anaeromyxobacter sp.]